MKSQHAESVTLTATVTEYGNTGGTHTPAIAFEVADAVRGLDPMHSHCKRGPPFGRGGK